jgi:uncharacterized membrane protein
MQINLCTLDRVIRGVGGVVLVAGGLLLVRGAIGVVLALVGAVLIFSASLGFCHVYKFLGMSTSKKA